MSTTVSTQPAALKIVTLPLLETWTTVRLATVCPVRQLRVDAVDCTPKLG